jgi:hypothetical protein
MAILPVWLLVLCRKACSFPAELNPIGLSNMFWIILIVILMIASVATAYMIPNERINTKNRKVNRP